jgi:hypothetical protein
MEILERQIIQIMRKEGWGLLLYHKFISLDFIINLHIEN